MAATTITPSASACPPTESPERLLVASAGGDSTAFQCLYDRLAPVVLAVTQRVLRNRAMAEEVAQEVFAEVWSKADRFDPRRGTAAGWVGTLARRRAVDRVRSEQASRDRDQRRAVMNQVRAFDEVADAVEVGVEHERVRVALDALTDVQREAIILAYYEGHTYRDVARLLGIPEGTAKSRLRDGLKRLGDELQPLNTAA